MRCRLEGAGKETKIAMARFHIDTVQSGGRYDGAAGVVSAMEAARIIIENNIPQCHSIDIVVFVEEEGSRYGSLLTGSWA